jgi:hypothetical protein
MDREKTAVQYFTGIVVVNQTFVLRINICGENLHLRKVLELQELQVRIIRIAQPSSIVDFAIPVFCRNCLSCSF